MTAGNRRQGRELALKIIYSFPDQPQDIERILAEFWRNFRFNNDVLGDAVDDPVEDIPTGVRRFAEQIARGVFAELERIDGALRRYASNWTLERMARVDLALLRLGGYELLCDSDVPANVAINEAIEIGKRYGTRETPSFVNGILDKIAKSERS